MLNPVPKPIKMPKNVQRNVIPKAKKKKKSPRQLEQRLKKRLEAKAKSICSAITKITWRGKCATCGNEGQAAHHFFGWKACSAVRFVLDNLIWLCYGCHIGKIHRQGLTEPAREVIIKRIGQAAFDRLYSRAFMRCDWTIDDLQMVVLTLEGILINLQREEAAGNRRTNVLSPEQVTFGERNEKRTAALS